MNAGCDTDDVDDDDEEIFSCIIEYSKPDNNRYNLTLMRVKEGSFPYKY